jgi:uncharacterized protein with GYD domain
MMVEAAKDRLSSNVFDALRGAMDRITVVNVRSMTLRAFSFDEMKKILGKMV